MRMYLHRFVQWLFITSLLLAGIGSYFWYQSKAGVTVNETPAPSEVSSDGLVGHWTFDGDNIDWSATGAEIQDTGSGGNDGDSFSMSALSSSIGKLGQALSFDGSADGIDLAGPTLTNTFTYSVWIYLQNTSGSYRPIITNNYYGLSFAPSSAGGCSNNPRIFFDVGSFQCSNTDLSENRWYHVVVSNSAGSATFYIDGSASGTASLGAYAPTVSTIGYNYNPTYFSGKIDDIRIYNRALSASEVYQLYTAGSAKVNAPSENPLSQSLRGYWKMDTGSGTSAVDSSGNGNTLSMTGSPSWTTGNIGPYSLDFSGSGQYLSIASPSSVLDFADGASFTITGWFNRDTFAADHTILSSKSAQTTSDGYIIWIDNNAGNDYLMFRADENGSTDAYTLTSSTNFSSTGWHHFAVSWNESAPNAVLYIDGNAEGSASGTAFASMGDLSNTNPFSVGAETDGDLPFDGKLDDIRIYGYALSADQVKKIYNTTAPTQPVDTSLVGHWTFDGPDIKGTTAIDRSSFGNNGTITGTTKTIGKLGQALSFNGTSDYINAGSASSLDDIVSQGGGGFSISAWVYPRSYGSDGSGSGFIFSKGWMFRFYVYGSGYLYFNSNYSGGGLDFRTTPPSLDLNKWQFVALVWDGGTSSTTSVKIYVNAQQKIRDWGADASGNRTSDANDNLFIGDSTYHDGTWDGFLDDVRIYNRVLSETEITNLYNLGR